MKTLVRLLASAVFACAMVSPTHAQTPVAATSKTVVVRAYESPINKIYISYGEGKTETEVTEGPFGKKDQLHDTEQLQKIVDRLYSTGYRIVSSVAGGVPGQLTVTYILRRE